MLPFLGTLLGALCVFFIGKQINSHIDRAICGFSAGVMVAAAIWSLLIPSMEIAKGKGASPAIPAASGFLFGIVFFLLFDKIIMQRMNSKKGLLPIIVVIVHNLPEGMAVGAIYAEVICGGSTSGLSAAMALSIGIAVQNLPEGAIVSMPMHTYGASKSKAFLIGALSGIVEPIGAVLTIFAAGFAVPVLPYLLGFAAGAMMYAVLEEFTSQNCSTASAVWVMAFACGFTLMMSLDVLLG